VRFARLPGLSSSAWLGMQTVLDQILDIRVGFLW
jgi:hypothetical protein